MTTHHGSLLGFDLTDDDNIAHTLTAVTELPDCLNPLAEICENMWEYDRQVNVDQ